MNVFTTRDYKLDCICC